MNNLPLDIHLQLPYWLEYDDQVAFAMVNRAISRHLIKHVRYIRLGKFKRLLRIHLTSEKIQSLIADPYNQLDIYFPVKVDLKEAGFEDIIISCKTLSITADQLTSSFMTSVKKVRSMMLGYNYGIETHPLTDSKLQSITDWMNNSNLGLKQLTIENYKITHLPVISKLESLEIVYGNISGLNLSAYSNLRCLKLDSVDIEDVSSLDGIHELCLSGCNSIRDISCLNHNYKIVIEECRGIIDYSNCFRNSRIIKIICPNYTYEPIKSCDLSKAMKAREIFFDGYYYKKPLLLLLPQSSSLRSVIVGCLPVRFKHSKHRIREIVLRDCILNPNSYLTNYGRIYSIKLINLEISSLIGLGRGNRVVEVDNCPSITDFSMLKHCDKLTIRNCAGFQDVEHVRGAKEFIFTPDYSDCPKDMEGVTCLILEYASENLFSMKFPRSLKKLVITPGIRDFTQRLPLFLARLPHHVEKIEVFMDYKILLQLLEKGEISFPDFIVEVHKAVHFFRKAH